MIPSSSAIFWLNEIVNQRVHSDLKLKLDRDKSRWLLSLTGSRQYLSFPLIVDLFRVPSRSLSCTNYLPANDKFIALEQSLPAPALETIPRPFLLCSDDSYHLSYDVFGLTFWMLTRCEEVDPPLELLDQHQRFPATASHAHRYGYLYRPLVDEWLGILRQLSQRVWPQLKLIRSNYELVLSHDVDAASAYAFVNKKRFIRVMVADLIKRRQINSILALLIRYKSRKYLHSSDPYNTFDWIMDCSDQIGVRSSFFFFGGRTDSTRDASYEIDHPAIRNLMRHIHSRGHDIGLHPSYNTFQHPERIALEASRLRTICMEEGIQQSLWGGRMHALRWEWPKTALGWELADFDYESTLTYADRPGFRTGTCHSYRMYDPVSDRVLRLIQRPLIAMECTVTDTRYLGLGYGDESAALFLKLQQNCKSVGGQFTLLWHNSNLYSNIQRNLYSCIINS